MKISLTFTGEKDEPYTEMELRQAMYSGEMALIIWTAMFRQEYAMLPAAEAMDRLCEEYDVPIQGLTQ